MYDDYVYKHFRSLSDEMLERERVAGNLLPEAQQIADEEHARRQASPAVVTDQPPGKKAVENSGPRWWHWVLLLLVIRAIYMFVKKW
jgi:hypothetical protein